MNLFPDSDDLSEIITAPVDTARAAKADAAAEAKIGFVESCSKCRGRGRFISFSGRDLGPCFNCKGAGKKTFKQSAEKRAQTRTTAAARKERKLADAILALFHKAPTAENTDGR